MKILNKSQTRENSNRNNQQPVEKGKKKTKNNWAKNKTQITGKTVAKIVRNNLYEKQTKRRSDAASASCCLSKHKVTTTRVTVCVCVCARECV